MAEGATYDRHKRLTCSLQHIRNLYSPFWFDCDVASDAFCIRRICRLIREPGSGKMIEYGGFGKLHAGFVLGVLLFGRDLKLQQIVTLVDG